MSPRRNRSPFEVALILTLLQLAGAVGLAIGVRPGVEPVPLMDRHAWLAEFPARWILTLGIWILVAFALLGFFVVVMWDRKSARFTQIAAWLIAGATLIALVARILLAGALPLVATLEGTRAFGGVEEILWRIEFVPTRILQIAAVCVLTRGLVLAGAKGRGLALLALLFSLTASAVVAAGLFRGPSLALYFVPLEVCLLGAWSLAVAVGGGGKRNLAHSAAQN